MPILSEDQLQGYDETIEADIDSFRPKTLFQHNLVQVIKSRRFLVNLVAWMAAAELAALLALLGFAFYYNRLQEVTIFVLGLGFQSYKLLEVAFKWHLDQNFKDDEK